MPIIKLENKARNVELIIQQSGSSQDEFPYDIIISDVFMPLDPDKNPTSDVEGGAVRIYRAIKQAQLYNQVFLVIMTNRNSDADIELRKLRADHKTYEVPWAIIHYPKPKTAPGPVASEQLLEPSDWADAIKGAILHCKDSEWKKTFIRSTLEEIVGCSSVLTEAKIRAARFANQRIVLIFGETGSGKDLIAKAIHDNSNRRRNTFTRFNCSNLPNKDLALTELFGCVKGFATSITARPGIFEQSLNGTVFLDEFGSDIETSNELDLYLRRFLREWKLKRLGETDEKEKIFTGTVIFGGSKLKRCLDLGELSDDFCSRVRHAQKINVPRLRDRREDIITLADFFLEKTCRQVSKPIKKLSREAQNKLQAYSWPGNVADVQGLMQNLSLVPKLVIGVDDLPEDIRSYVSNEASASNQPDPSVDEVIAAFDKANMEKAEAARILYQLPSSTHYEGEGGVQTYVKRINTILATCSDHPKVAAILQRINSRGGRRKKK